jgi:hypothetical protein
MTLPELRAEDRALLKRAGLSIEEVERQVTLLADPPPPIRLDRACTLHDGITRLEQEDDDWLLPCWEQASRAGRLSKFVPASGAASRMFDAAERIRREGAPSRAALVERRAGGDPDGYAMLELLDRLRELPFVDDLARVLGPDDGALDPHTGEEIARLLDALLGPAGLGLSSLPKGMIPFHRYADGTRTAFEEHLLEGFRYIADLEGRATYHFTVPASQEGRFEEVAARVAERHGLGLRLRLSVQDPSTDTVAIDDAGRLMRHPDGSLVLRPGGHGALLGNLEATGGDVVFIKNIDNIVPSTRHEEIALWMKRLAGLLLETEGRSHELQGRLSKEPSPAVLGEAEAFCHQRLAWKPAAVDPDERRREILNRLDRPLRVCGMVPNEGEPGGGPFWVREAGDRTSAQIVESAQIDADDPSQGSIWATSTHFNPVLLVVSIRDRHAEPYRLADFVDPRAVWVSSRPIAGETARVLEHPGLWNGAMAAWNTVFAEVPISTFAPVKTVLDLLRPAHRVSED